MDGKPYHIGLPWDVSAHGHQIDNLIISVHWFMFALFIGWGIFFVYCLLKFRQRAGHRASYQSIKGKYSKISEIIVGVIELVLLIGFSMPVWAAYKNEPPPLRFDGKQHEAGTKFAFEVRVVGEQFAWNFHYPGPDGKFGRTRPDKINPGEGNPLGLDDADPNGKDDIVSPELHVPQHQDVYIRISSKDVIHSFDIPVARVKQDAIPGVQVPVWFKAEHFNNDDLRRALTKSYSLEGKDLTKLVSCVAARDYKNKAGEVILKSGDSITDDVLAQLRAGGATSIDACPRVGAEVVCSQLCGGNHYQMKAPFFIDTEEEYNKWLASQAAPPADQKQPQGDFQL